MTAPQCSGNSRTVSRPGTPDPGSVCWGLPFADELLRASQITINQVDCFLINRGPGSFTGLRVGFATLIGLIAFDPKPCYACDSLDALAERIPADRKKNLAICLDAFRSKFYVKIFENKNGQANARYISVIPQIIPSLSYTFVFK